MHIVLTRETNFRGAITSNGHLIPTLVLSDCYMPSGNSVSISNANLETILTTTDFPPCLEQIQFDYDVLVRILAQQRVFQRIEQMKIRFREVSLDELIYEFLFYSLGMGTKYAPTYKQLALSLPYSYAKKMLEEDLRILESVYLHAIGYLQEGVRLKNPYALILEGIRCQNEEWIPPIEKPHEDSIYCISSVYPYASPALRIAGMIGLLSKVEGSLSEFLYSLGEKSLQDSSPWTLWEKYFYTQHYYWSYYTGWEMQRRRNPHSLIGRERIYSILGNILLPFFLFSIQEGLWGQREEKVWSLYYRLPGENNHWLLKRMKTHAEFLFPHRPLKFFEQQALIQWYKTGCALHPGCVDCPWQKGNKE